MGALAPHVAKISLNEAFHEVEEDAESTVVDSRDWTMEDLAILFAIRGDLAAPEKVSHAPEKLHVLTGPVFART